ncbi:MAG: tetratricopeptide repeat protein, partial [Rivularia sp. ALOHA_DT_140]|nr:tetratricopeptide repeat protein [Rivularia sp. ALOHA_DT_140]
MKSQGVNQKLKVKSKSSNLLKTSSLLTYSLSLFKIKYTLILISLLGIFGVFTFASEVVMGQMNSPILKEKTSKDINTINGKLDSSSKKLSDKNIYYNIHNFEGKAGDKIFIELTSKDFDAYLILRDSEDNNIAEDNNSGEGNNAKIFITLPSTGTYKIFATHKAGKSGNYQLSWRIALPRDIELAEAGRLNQRVLQLLEKGKYSEAIPLAERGLAIRQKILGEHRDVATSLNNLASSYEYQGRYKEAEPLYKQSLQMRRNLLGKQHHHVATSLNNLAGLYESQGRYKEAEPLYKQSLGIYEQSLGKQ